MSLYELLTEWASPLSAAELPESIDKLQPHFMQSIAANKEKIKHYEVMKDELTKFLSNIYVDYSENSVRWFSTNNEEYDEFIKTLIENINNYNSINKMN